MYAYTNPISIKVGTLSKNAIKTKISNLLIHFNIYLTDKRTNKRCSVFSLSLFPKYKQIYKLMPATHTPKNLWQRHVYHWVTSHFILINNPLGTEYINCCSFASGIFAHSWCLQNLLNCPWSQSDSPLHDAPYILNRRQIWTVGRPVKHTHSMPMKPHCCNSCRMRPGIVLLK